MKKKNQSQEKTGKEGRADYRGFRQTLVSPDNNDSLKSLEGINVKVNAYMEDGRTYVEWSGFKQVLLKQKKSEVLKVLDDMINGSKQMIKEYKRQDLKAMTKTELDLLEELKSRIEGCFK